ncbi:MAG: glutathione S-transferase family protein [Rhodobacteraceae bacterium]|nr:glutathione S-transferase family protein [Paracoccaceae bacterium]
MTYRLYHYALSPFCRKLRLVLSEKEIKFELIEEKYWEKRREFQEMNPAGTVPVLRDENVTLSESRAICEYIEALYPDPRLFPVDPLEQFETRRMISWIDEKLHHDVTSRLVGERVLKRVQERGPPVAETIAKGRKGLQFHFTYFEHLLGRRDWIAGPRMTMADFAAAAHISCLDFIGDIDWRDWPFLKNWYATMKSRPAFRPLLSEYHMKFPHPPEWYSDLDF